LVGGIDAVEFVDAPEDASVYGLDVPTLLALGAEIDGGMNAEALLINLAGTELQESACDFSLTQKPGDVYTVITQLQKTLVRGVESFLRGQPAPPPPAPQPPPTAQPAAPQRPPGNILDEWPQGYGRYGSNG